MNLINGGKNECFYIKHKKEKFRILKKKYNIKNQNVIKKIRIHQGLQMDLWI